MKWGDGESLPRQSLDARLKPCMQKETNSAPSVPPNFEILPLKFWKVSSDSPYSKLKKTYYLNNKLKREVIQLM